MNGRGRGFDPEGAKALRAGKVRLKQEQANLDAEIQAVIEKAKRNVQQKAE